MTPIILLQRLKEFIENEIKDLILQVKGDKKGRAAEVHLMQLPDIEDKIQRIPYVVLQFVKNTDKQPEGELTESSTMIRIVAATYSEDCGVGAMDVLNLLTRIRTALLRDRVIGRQFILNINTSPLEMIVYPDDTAPYFLGEMASYWDIPPINREEDLWQEHRNQKII